MNSPNNLALPAGTVISGYEIVRVLGAGGFGITYEGYNRVTQRRAAIKEFFPRGIASREGATKVVYSIDDMELVTWALDRFERSTTELAKLKHPNIVDVLNYVPANETGYMFMESVEGKTFEDWLRARGGTISFEEIRAVVAPVCAALEYVHARKFIHRDIAPDNIMLRADGSPVLIDFGAIKLIEQHTLDHAAAPKSFAVAKRHYSPPEQAMDDAKLDLRADIYALAAVVYRAATGAPPADAEQRKTEFFLNNADPYVPVSQAALMPLPGEAAAAIDRALSLKPQERPATVAEFRAALASEMAEMPPTMPVVPGSFATPGFSSDADEDFPKPHWRRRLAIAAVIALVLIGAGAFLLLRQGGGDVAVTPPLVTVEPKLDPAEPDVPNPFTAHSDAASAKPHIERGIQLMSDQKFDEAVSQFSEAIKLDPTSAESYRRRAAAWTENPAVTAIQYALAEEDFANALKLAGDNKAERLLVLAQRARAYGDQGKTKEQFADLTAAIALSPKDPELYSERGGAYQFNDAYDAAYADMTTAIELDPKNANRYVARAGVSRAKEDYVAAIADLSEAIRLAPEAGIWLAHRAQVHALRGDLTQAIADYDDAIKRDPTAWEYHRERADTYVRRAAAEPNRSPAQDLQQAKESLDTIFRSGAPEPSDYEKRGLILEKLGLTKEAIADLRIALSQDQSLGESRAALKRLGVSN